MSDIDPPGYSLLDVLPVDTPERMRALADPLRTLIVDLVLERAMTVTELAARVGKPRGTVAHHVDVLCDSGLLQVVRTRKVRAMEERFYGRVARTYVFPTHDGDDLPFASEARGEWDRARHDLEDVGGFTLRHARIPADRANDFWERVLRMAIEFTQSSRDGDVEYAFYTGVFPTNRPVAPRKRASTTSSTTSTRRKAVGRAS
jgi:DNA-binding transcriptional ArsR family regulator